MLLEPLPDDRINDIGIYAFVGNIKSTTAGQNYAVDHTVAASGFTVGAWW